MALGRSWQKPRFFEECTGAHCEVEKMVSRRAHNPDVAGSNPALATKLIIMQTAISHKTIKYSSFRREVVDLVSVGIRQREAINKVKKLPMPADQKQLVTNFEANKYKYSDQNMKDFLLRNAEILIMIMPASNPPALHRLKQIIAEKKNTTTPNPPLKG